MLDQRAGVSVSRDNRELTVRRGNGERRHSARDGLDDVVKDDLANRGEPGRIGQRASQMLRDRVKCRR